jgi:hypothetical protein
VSWGGGGGAGVLIFESTVSDFNLSHLVETFDSVAGLGRFLSVLGFIFLNIWQSNFGVLSSMKQHLSTIDTLEIVMATNLVSVEKH